jgi:NAD(P)-dependent dehydrogenase (short-subunit alcohol dehydrogenase family)
MTTTANTLAVVVTGASRGLGAAITSRLAVDGYTVFAAARRRIPPCAPGVIPLTLDVTDHRSVHAAAAIVAERLDGHGLHALINNAAVLEAGPLELADPATVARHLQTNIVGPITAVQAFLPQLRARHGRILNISSINASLPLPCWGLYSASKAALAALTDSLRIELAASGVAVSLLTLGAFATDIRRNALAAWPAAGRSTEARAAMEALVGMLDAAAADPAIVTDAVANLLTAPQPAAHLAVGDGVEDLLALAAQPAEVRDAAIVQLLGAAQAAALR